MGWAAAARWALFYLLTAADLVRPAAFQGPCADLQPLYLLHYLVPDRQRLPAGLELIYDPLYHVHAYRLTPHAATLSFPASPLFPHCALFPEEYSFLITFKVSPSAALGEETLVAFIPRGSTEIKIGVRLERGFFHVDFWDRVQKRRKVVEFKSRQFNVFDDIWHVLVVAVSGRSVSLSVDCGEAKTRTVKRPLPALVNIEGDNIHIGNSNKEDSGLFSGSLREVILLPGADISTLACPANPPDLPDIVPPTTPAPTEPFPPYPHESRCTWRDTGTLSFDVHSRDFRVCYSGAWQPAQLNHAEKRPPRLDYVVWHQDLVTAAPTIDLEVFHIPDEGLFMATASFDSRNPRKQQSAIFRWEDNKFRMFQSLYTLGAQAWEFFTIGKKHFLAVANHGAKRDKPSKSVIYVWSRKRRRFRVYQEIVTWTARDLEYFSIKDNHYLVVANHVMGQNHTIDSIILQWGEMEKKFKMVDKLTTTGAYDWTHFKIDGYDLLAVANSYSGPPESTTKMDSVIYFWQNGRFLPFQSLETTGATDWEFFAIGNEFFLAVANAYNYGPHTTNETERFQTNSTIYRLNTLRKKFEIYQEIITYSAVDWESFTVGDDHYIIVSNAQQGRQTADVQTGPPDLRRTRSVIYRWQGVEKFVPVHYLDSLPSTDWEVFEADGNQYMVYANADENISQIYRIKVY